MTELERIFQEWEQLIQDIATKWVTLWHQRLLIQKKTELLREIYRLKKDLKDKRLELKAREMKEVQHLMDNGIKKTPAREEVEELSRWDRYNLEKIEIDLELMNELAKNRTYHMRINELDINKVGDLPNW